MEFAGVEAQDSVMQSTVDLLVPIVCVTTCNVCRSSAMDGEQVTRNAFAAEATVVLTPKSGRDVAGADGDKPIDT